MADGYASYVIFFRNEADFIFATTAFGPAIRISPQGAASMFGLDFPPPADIHLEEKGIYYVNPFIPGYDIENPEASGIILSATQDSFDVPGQPGTDTSAPGEDLTLYWSGQFILAAKNVATSENAPIPRRRWIGGMESQSNQEGGVLAGQAFSRDGTRVLGGHGRVIRGGFQTTTWRRTITEYRAGLEPPTSWERFYVRIRNLGEDAIGIWRSEGSVSAGNGIGLTVDLDGRISAFNRNSIGGLTLLATTDDPLELNTWYLFDLILEYAVSPAVARFRLFINHENEIDEQVTSGTGLNGSAFHAASQLGIWNSPTDDEAEIDLDDWICADVPNNAGGESLTSLDWLTGSHVIGVNTLEATLPDWTGNFGVLNQRFSPITEIESQLISTTSGAAIDGLTDARHQPDDFNVNIGAIAAIVGMYGAIQNATDGQLGYRIADGTVVLTTVDQTGTLAFESVAYLLSGVSVPARIDPFHVNYVKSANTSQGTVNSIVASIEYIGIFGKEDNENAHEVNKYRFLHNARFPNTTFGFLGPAPPSPVRVIADTYTGNDTYQEIEVGNPFHFLFIHNITQASIPVVFWFGASLGSHQGTLVNVNPNIRVWADDDGICKFSVQGDGTQLNSSGDEFQYVVFCDPGMRFNICGAFAHEAQFPVPAVNELIDEHFTPLAGFVQMETPLNQGTRGLFFKGPGNLVDEGTSIGAGLLDEFGNFDEGQLLSLADLHSNNFTSNYSLWRTRNTGPAGVMVQITSYTGDGSSPRVIPLTPVSNRFPLFAIVIAATDIDACFVRYPANTGSNSHDIDGGGVSTVGIIGGGLDSITVSTGLNTLGEVYNVFVFPGGDTSQVPPTSWSPPGDFHPPTIPPVFPPPEDDDTPTFWGPPPEPPDPDIIIVGEGGLILGGEPISVLLKDISGIYTLIPGKTDDTLYDRQTGQENVDVKIPDPLFKTGFIGG